MADRRYMAVRDFKAEGFLLEANRLFFHPHGLALEIRRVASEEGAPVFSQAFTAELYAELQQLAAGASPALQEAIAQASRYDVGDCYLSGIWDCRDDPEGVIMGGLSDEEKAKTEAVSAERERHREAREALFGWAHDVEPVDWKLDVAAGTACPRRRRPATGPAAHASTLPCDGRLAS